MQIKGKKIFLKRALSKTHVYKYQAPIHLFIEGECVVFSAPSQLLDLDYPAWRESHRARLGCPSSSTLSKTQPG